MGRTQGCAVKLVVTHGQKAVSIKTGIKEERLKTIRYKEHASVRTDELDAITHAYPEYEQWLRIGIASPENGHLSPDG